IWELEALQCHYGASTQELEELRSAHQRKWQELQRENEKLCSAYQRKVQELQRENEGSLRKLQETAEQFEWLCEQQRYWMCCVKRLPVRGEGGSVAAGELVGEGGREAEVEQTGLREPHPDPVLPPRGHGQPAL
ncbi:hypothetical protein J4Q44_G00315740, partial [Coregonus suidteri]